MNKISKLLNKTIFFEKLATHASGSQEFGAMFSLDKLKQIYHIDDMMLYAKSFLEVLGEDSGRIVCALTPTQVLKIAKDKTGIAQNKAELDAFVNSDAPKMVTKIYDHDTSNIWIVAEVASPIGSEKLQKAKTKPWSGLWYHGTQTKFVKFDYQHAYTANSTAQYGPGFYLTDSKELASGYANGAGYLLTVDLTRRGRIINGNAAPTKVEIDGFIERMPDKESVLSNWDESQTRAVGLLQQSLKDNNETVLEMIQSIWADCYRGHEHKFIKSLVMRSMIDGILIPQQNGVNFLIVYNPDILKIVNSELIGPKL